MTKTQIKSNVSLMEREPAKNFSIESYIESGGILGNEITVNQKAAESIMKRTALRRNFNVSKGYYRDEYEAEGSEELAISTVKAQNLNHEEKISASGFSTLTKDLGNWKLLVHDQQIADDIDSWMQKNFKSEGNNNGHQVFRESYIKKFKNELTNEIMNAFWSEKKEIFSYPFKNHKRSLFLELLLIGSTSGVASIHYDVVTNNADSGTEKVILVTVPMVCLGILMSIYDFSLRSRYKYNEIMGIVNKFEKDVLNPQIPSIVCGTTSILLNSSKLIKLNNTKQ